MHCSRLMDNISDRDASHLNTYIQYVLYGKYYSLLFVFLFKVKKNEGKIKKKTRRKYLNFNTFSKRIDTKGTLAQVQHYNATFTVIADEQ